MNQKNKFKLFFMVLAIVGISGCEYELSKEYFRDISKPSGTRSFSLNLSSKQDTILIYGNVNLTYDFRTDDLEVIEVQFRINDEIIVSNKNKSGVITINSKDYKAGVYTLKATLYTHSGSTSIADYVGAEGYMVEREWVLEVNDYYTPVVKNPVISKTDEGFLKISWEKFNKPDLFISYHLDLPSNAEVVIRDINTTSFVDSMYIGFNSVALSVQIKGANGSRYSQYAYSDIQSKFPAIKFENRGLDSVRLYWNQSTYKTKYHLYVAEYHPHYLYDSKTDLLKNNLDTSVVIHKCGFDEYSAFNLQVESFTTTPGRSPLMRTFNTVIYNWGLQFVTLGGLNLSYNQTEDVLYYTVYGYAYSCNLLSLQRYKSLNWSASTPGNNACPVNSTKVAILSPSNLYIFDNKNLDTKISMPLQRNPNFMSMSDNEIVVMTSLSSGLEYISVADKKILASQPFTSLALLSKWPVTSSSNDAKYTCVLSINGISIYEFNNPSLSKSYTSSDVYRSCLFDRISPYTLYMTKDNSDILEIRNAADFSLLKTIKMKSTNAFLCNVDPMTGFLLTADLSNAHIICPKTGKTIYSIRCTSAKPRLYGGKLISDNGRYVDITEKLHE